jgi:hypothetical protein
MTNVDTPASIHQRIQLRAERALAYAEYGAAQGKLEVGRMSLHARMRSANV